MTSGPDGERTGAPAFALVLTAVLGVSALCAPPRAKDDGGGAPSPVDEVDDVLDKMTTTGSDGEPGAVVNAGNRARDAVLAAIGKKNAPPAPGPESKPEPKAEPGSPAESRLAAANDLRNGDFQAAAAHSEAALAKNPDDPRALTEHALALAGQGRRADAYSDAKRASDLDPSNASAARLATLLAPSSMPGALKPKALAFEARPPEEGPPGGAAGQAGRPARAAEPAPGPRAAAVALSAPGPLKAAALRTEAVRMVQLGDGPRAHGFASQALAAATTPAEEGAAYLLRGKALRLEGKDKEAADDETKALARDPDGAAQALVDKSWDEVSKQALEEAKQDADAAERVEPESSELAALEAEIRAMEAADPETREKLAAAGGRPARPRRAFGPQPFAVDALLTRADAYSALGDAVQAKADRSAARRLDPSAAPEAKPPVRRRAFGKLTLAGLLAGLALAAYGLKKAISGRLPEEA